MRDFDVMRLTESGPSFTRMGMGCWAVGGHGWGAVKDDESLAAVRHAFERGVTFFDTADAYGLGKSENILFRALGKDISSVFVASKGGVRWDESGRVWNDSSQEYLQIAVEASLRRLGLEHIPLYYIHKPDNKTPISEMMGTLLRLREAGKIGEIGVSNFSAEQLTEALTVAPVRAVQVQFNLLQRAHGEELVSLCGRHKVKLVAWGALADGLLTGKFTRKSAFGNDDHRSRLPDFQGARFQRNLQLVEALRIIANERGVSVSQLALRWVMDRYEWTCPLFGAKTVTQVEENLGAAGWHLSREEMAAIDALIGCFERRA
jgi:aryl-alcohol dehydrogenase-like predicted oxidoreductase